MDIKHKFYTIDEMVYFLHTHAGHVYAVHAHDMHATPRMPMLHTPTSCILMMCIV
jgi:hypothetical protein